MRIRIQLFALKRIRIDPGPQPCTTGTYRYGTFQHYETVKLYNIAGIRLNCAIPGGVNFFFNADPLQIHSGTCNLTTITP
jgi:hypothetical protein